MIQENYSELNSSTTAEAPLSEQQLNMLNAQLQSEQNLQLAVISGFVAAMIGALLWAMITVVTGYQIGFMAIGVGILVGFTVSYFGKGIDKIFGISGAVLALIGCATGNFLTIVYLASVYENISVWQILANIELGTIISVMTETFEGFDLVFYGIAVYEGYRFSFRKINQQDMAKVNA